jgi:anthranilate synthase component 2
MALMRILLLDNYDSFTYNLLHYLEKVSDATIEVVRNDKIVLDEVEKYDKIVLSPGPGLPEDAGLLMPLIDRFKHSKSILGVCLGHQALAMSFGGKLINLPQVVHGVATPISILSTHTIFKGLPSQFKVGRYHSWVIQQLDLPKELVCEAVDDSNNVMAFSHETLPLYGVQFHPESILTEYGLELISNWVKA